MPRSREAKGISGFTNDVKQAVRNAQHGYCKTCEEPLIEFHHLIPNTITNQQLFPLFIGSPFNCAGTCRKCHELKKAQAPTLDEAVMYESYLKELKDVTKTITMDYDETL